MQDELFLIYDCGGIRRTTKNAPKLGAGEHCTRLVLKVPDRFFSNPIPSATLEVPETAVGGPAPTVGLSSMEEICMVQEGVLGKSDEGHGSFFCPECGFEHWRRDFGTHYRPNATAGTTQEASP